MRKTVLAGAVLALVGLLVGQAVAADFGTVKVDGKNTAVEVQINKKIKVVVTSKGTRFPVGTHVPIGYRVMKRDSAGKVWSISSNVGAITVTKDQTTTLTVSPLIKVRGSVSERRIEERTRRPYYNVWPTLQGSDGQSFGSYAWKGGAKRAPAFRIEDEQGRVLAEGKFEFG